MVNKNIPNLHDCSNSSGRGRGCHGNDSGRGRSHPNSGRGNHGLTRYDNNSDMGNSNSSAGRRHQDLNLNQSQGDRRIEIWQDGYNFCATSQVNESQIQQGRGDIQYGVEQRSRKGAQRNHSCRRRK